jgi:hypothetical protein
LGRGRWFKVKTFKRPSHFENALNAYNVLLSGNRLEDKTIGSIDRVLDKLFENSHEQNISADTTEPKVSMGDLQKFIKTMSDVAKH